MNIIQDNKPRTEPGNETNNSPRNQLQDLNSEIQTLTELERFQEATQLCEKLIADFPGKPAGFVGLTRIAFRQQNYALTLERCGQWMHNFPDELPFFNFKAEALINLDRLEEAEEFCRLLTDKFPGKPAGFVGLTRIAFRQQDYVLTLERCGQWMHHFPQELRFFNFKAEALINLDRFEEAEQFCRLLTDKFPGKPAGFVGLTRIAFRQQDYALTLERCGQWIHHFPQELRFFNFKAEALINLDRFEEAEQFCRLLTDKFPGKPAGFVGLTRIAFRQQDYALTLERCGRWIHNFPCELPFYNFKVEALINLDRLEEAGQFCRLLTDKFPSKPVGFVGLARITFRQQDYELSIATCERFLTRFPIDFTLLCIKADAFLALMQFENAERPSQLLIEHYPTRPAGYLIPARSAYMQGRYEIVLELCRQIIGKFPNELGASVLMANTLIAMSHFEKAKQQFQNILIFQPYKPAGYLGIIRVSVAQSQFEYALKLCEKAISLFPFDIEAYCLKGNALLALSRFQEAKTLYDQMVSDFPHRINGHAGLYHLFRKLEKHHSALNAIKAAYNLNPRNIFVINQYVTILELMGRVEEAYTLLKRRITEDKHDVCLVPLVNLYSKYGESTKILALLESNSKFFTDHPDLQIKVGFALRNKGDLTGSYTIFSNYLDTDSNASLQSLKYRFRIYEQLLLLKSITDNHKLFKHFFLESTSLRTPHLHPKRVYNDIIERLRQGEFAHCEKLLNNNVQPKPNDNFQNFIRKVVDLAKELDMTSSGFAESYLDTGESPISAIKLSEKLIHRIQHKIPTSMIRLGDGEGNFLDYPEKYSHWQNKDIEDIQRIWWGDVKLEEHDKDNILFIFSEVVNNADILGIPDLVRKVRDMDDFEGQAHNRHSRGSQAIFHHLKKTIFNKNRINSILTSCHYHTDLEFWDLYRYILRNVSKVTVITCHHDIGRVLNDRFGIRSVKIILIPSEHRHSHNFNSHDNENGHFPRHFRHILNTLAVGPGDVFLVAAGFLGKIYCNSIKNKGGIGIDIGSTADIWMGYSTRMEHEYLHPILGVNLDFDKLRKKTFSQPPLVQHKQYYRSNYYCDMDIYCEGDEFSSQAPYQSKRLLITGHPRCGSRYMALLFCRMGVEVNHEWFGIDGICSWLYAVKDLNMPVFGKHHITTYASFFTKFDYTIAYVRDPIEALPSIMLENRVERSYNYRRNHIINELGINIDDYRSDLERAIASYLFWNKIVQIKNPVATFKVEDCVQDVYKFLQDHQLLKDPIDLASIDIATNANSTALRGIAKPEVPVSSYRKIASHLKTELSIFCERHGYDDPAQL